MILFVCQVTEFIERLMKHASNGEVLMFKKPLDARLHQLFTYTPDLNLAALTELEFISNFQAIQVRRFFYNTKSGSLLHIYVVRTT